MCICWSSVELEHRGIAVQYRRSQLKQRTISKKELSFFLSTQLLMGTFIFTQWNTTPRNKKENPIFCDSMVGPEE